MIMKVPNMFVPADTPFGSSKLRCWCNHQEYAIGVRNNFLVEMHAG